MLYGAGFLIIGLRYGILIGAMAMALTMIPFLGAIVTCATALILALVQYGDWRHPLLVLVVFAIVQTLEGLVISPKIMGGRVGLHPVTIIIAVMTPSIPAKGPLTFRLASHLDVTFSNIVQLSLCILSISQALGTYTAATMR